MSAAFRAIASAACELGVGKEAGPNKKQDDAYSVQYFFHSIYQQQPALFRGTRDDVVTTQNSDSSCDSNASALRNAFDIGWDDVAALLHHCRHEYSTTGTPPPLFFQDGVPIADPLLYASNPHAAYLDGCSVIINHADLHHLTIARLCDDLQQSFPHVYANAYLTPARSHAVAAHADDRDVLVFQILGKKKWKVYKKVPVEFPFEKEQVGKHGNNAVDASVLQGGLCFNDDELILHPGDVLYLPRGYVHEASTENTNDVTSENDPSFHITVAIATHDWCLSVLLSETIRETLNGLPQFRKALPIGPCEEYESFSQGDHSGSYLKQLLDSAMGIIHGGVTPSLLENKLRKKYLLHNDHAAKHREKLLKMNQCKKRRVGPYECVGDDASMHVTVNSIIRVSTQEERSSVSVGEGCLRGLTVREETMPMLMMILSQLKGDTMLRVKVKDLRDVIKVEDRELGIPQLSMLCDFTLLSFARCCVELGALALEDA